MTSPLRIYRGDGKTPPPKGPTPPDRERLIATLVEYLGTEEAFHRLTLSGPYQAIWDEIQRRGRR